MWYRIVFTQNNAHVRGPAEFKVLFKSHLDEGILMLCSVVRGTRSQDGREVNYWTDYYLCKELTKK